MSYEAFFFCVRYKIMIYYEPDMKINCKICDTPVVIRYANASFACMCDEDLRIIPLEQIKYGFYKDKVYLFEAAEGSTVYEKPKTCLQTSHAGNV